MLLSTQDNQNPSDVNIDEQSKLILDAFLEETNYEETLQDEFKKEQKNVQQNCEAN